MKITGLKTFMQRVGDRPRLLVRVDTDEGISGWGEAYNHGPDWALPPMLEYLYLQIEGIDPRRIEFIYQKLLQSSRFPPGAIGLAAISAVEHALWDISGKAAGLPVYMLLGGNVRDRVRVYCGVYTAPDPQDCLERTQALHAQYGFTAFKLSPCPAGPACRALGQCVQRGRGVFRPGARDQPIGMGIRVRRARENLRALPGDPDGQRAGPVRSAVL